MTIQEVVAEAKRQVKVLQAFDGPVIPPSDASNAFALLWRIAREGIEEPLLKEAENALRLLSLAYCKCPRCDIARAVLAKIEER